MDDLLADLDREQRLAVLHRQGPLFIAAGPGSGKTRVISRRMAHLIGSGQIAPNRLLAITFTNRAAAEMKSRVGSLLGSESELRIGTFHWACQAILRRYADRAGISRSFRLLSPSEARAVVRDVAHGLPPRDRNALPAAVSAVKNGAPLEEAARRLGISVGTVAAVKDLYASELRAQGALDLDDLLSESVRLLSENEAVRDLCRAAYDEILVDEFQDTNPVQQKLLDLLVPPSRRLVVVGDPDQAIFGWRQADSRGTDRFFRSFPDAALVSLTCSYRSSKRILRAASRLIAHNSGRLGDETRTPNPAGERPVCYAAHDETEEADWVAARLERLAEQGVPFDGAAVLYRVNAQSRAVEDALVRRGVPYHVVGSLRFYDRPEVRKVVAYLALSRGEDEQAAAWLARSVPGIGDQRMNGLVERARQASVPLLESFQTRLPGVPAPAIDRLRAIRDTATMLRRMKAEPLNALVDAAVRWVMVEVERDGGIDLDTASENLAEFRSAIAEMGPRTTLSNLLDRVSLGIGEERGRGVTLMTLHAAKGSEFQAVFVVGLEEGLLPYRRSLNVEADVEEERRLCYVGMTRAKEHLYLSYAHTRLLGGHPSFGHPSRFIGEIGSHLLTMEVSPKRRTRPRLTEVSIGERVFHPRWKEGIVTGVEGTGKDTLVTIRFAAGAQRLQLCHAPLSRLNGEGPRVLAG